MRLEHACLSSRGSLVPAALARAASPRDHALTHSHFSRPRPRSTFDDTHVHIDERHSLPRKSTTNYKAKMGKGYLTIEQIWFLAKSTSANPKAAHPAYLKEALAAKFAAVSLVDRKDLLDFLTGKTDTSANIDLNVPAFTDVQVDVPRDEEGAKRSREDGAAHDEESARPRARPLHTRNSALQCDKSFGAVLGFFGAAEGSGSKPKTVEEPKIAPLKSTRFEDVDTREFYKAQLGRDFTDLGIVENAGFLGGNRKVLPELSAAEQARAEAVTGHKIEKSGADKALPVAGRASRSSTKPREDYAKGKTPIILVPAGFGSKVLFNMYNAARFLQEETLVTWDTYHKRGDKKATRLDIKRRYKRSPSVKYRVTDEVPSRDSKDWQCVVAVFVSGKAWQFKDWPFKGADEGDLVETFAKVRGFYAQYDTETPADVIKTWNVQTLRFQKNVRHGDRAQFEQFWNEVDKHLELNRSQLKY